MTVVDWLILVPVIPAAPIIITWWLPWERWLWDKVPKKILGLYLFYMTFVAWHFEFHWWVVLGLGIWALIVVLETFKVANHERHDGEQP
jgi:hypothetical protein